MAAMAAVPLGTVPSQQLEWSVDWGNQLVAAIDCCTVWRRVLQQTWQDAAKYDKVVSSSGSQQQPAGSSGSDGSQQQAVGSHASKQQPDDSGQCAAQTAASALAAYWLQHGNLAAEFASIESAIEISVCDWPRSPLAGQAQELQRLGAVLSAKVPVPWMCNNPGCTCMDGVSELQLVGGKACVCGGCGVAR